MVEKLSLRARGPKRKKFPVFSHFGSFELTVLRDGESDRDKIFIWNRPIMGVDDPAGTIDLARCGAKIWIEYGKNQKNRKKHQNSSQSEETVMIFGFPALGLPRNVSQLFWSTTKKFVHLCNQTIQKLARTMLIAASLHHSLWAEAVSAAVHLLNIINICPTT